MPLSVTPEEKVFESDVDFVSVPSLEGSLGLLPEHLPIVCQLNTGIIKFRKGKEDIYIAIQKGYMEFFNNYANILTGRAIKTTYQDRYRAIEEVSKKHDIVQEIAEETKKVIQAISSLRKLKKITIFLPAGC
ncbi:MAG: ATP synthase F1 subunit epsilon [Actinomycetota bacterium]|nr:ATP synthase F1 subunit epsilon [Actinomycetota bacterium]